MDYATAWFYFSAFLLGMYLAFDGFDLGIGTLLAFVKDQRDRDVLINTIAPVWDGNEVWFITWGAGLFAMWPALYATLFSTFYLAVWLLAFLFIFRAVSFEFRNRNKALWDKLFAVVSALIALILGVIVGNLIQGLPLDASGAFKGSLLTLFRPYPLIVGLFVLFAVMWHGANWAVYKTTGKLQETMRGYAFKFWLLTVVFLLLTVIGMKIWAPLRFERLMTPLGLGLTLVILVAGLLDGYLIKKGEEKLTFYISWLAFPLVTFLIYYSMYPYWIISTISDFKLDIHDLAASPLTLQAVLGVSVVLAIIIMAYTLYVYRMFGGKVEEATGYY